MCWIKSPIIGRVKGVTFRDISYTGRTCVPCRLIGYEDQSDIRDVRFDQITINGCALPPEGMAMSRFIVNQYVHDVSVDGTALDMNTAHFEPDEDTRSSYLIGNGAYIKL